MSAGRRILCVSVLLQEHAHNTKLYASDIGLLLSTAKFLMDMTKVQTECVTLFKALWGWITCCHIPEM